MKHPGRGCAPHGRMLPMENDYTMRLGLKGEQLTDEQVTALCEDIDARRVGLDRVTSSEGYHFAEVSTAFMVEIVSLTLAKGGPYETLVRRLDSLDAEPGDELAAGARYWTAADAAVGHQATVEVLGRPGMLRLFCDTRDAAAALLAEQ